MKSHSRVKAAIATGSTVTRSTADNGPLDAVMSLGPPVCRKHGTRLQRSATDGRGYPRISGKHPESWPLMRVWQSMSNRPALCYDHDDGDDHPAKDHLQRDARIRRSRRPDLLPRSHAQSSSFVSSIS